MPSVGGFESYDNIALGCSARLLVSSDYEGFDALLYVLHLNCTASDGSIPPPPRAKTGQRPQVAMSTDREAQNTGGVAITLTDLCCCLGHYQLSSQ